MTHGCHAGGGAPIVRPASLSSASRRLVAALTMPVALLEGLTWPRIGYLALVSALWALLVDGHGWLLGMRPATGNFVEVYPSLFVDSLLGFALQLLALVIADNLRIERVPRALKLTLALFLGSALTGLVFELPGPSPTASAFFVNLLNVTLGHSIVGGAFAFVFFTYRHDVEVAEALHRAELGQVALRRRTLESGLQAMQARVEPQFLLDTLRGVGDLYETDRCGAERMLDSLIRYLRAALPQMRSSESTLGREVGLAEAYLNIANIRSGRRLDFSFTVPDTLHGAAFPPMVLLPLIERLALRGANTPGESTTLRVEGRTNGQALAIEVICSGPVAGESVEDLRDRLVALYSDRARLVVERRGARETLATLVVPQLAG
jgi:hypothetical protein